MISETENESESEDEEVVEDDRSEEEDVNEGEQNDDDQNIVNESDDDTIVDPAVAIRRSARVKKRKECGCCNLVVSNGVDVPKNVNDVKSSNDCKEWRAAMQTEMNMMYKKDVWEIVPRPKQGVVVGCRWVFTKKPDRFKARLVAQGFKKRFNFNYEETFSPVIKRKSMRILMAIAIHNDWTVEHLDVTNAYLNAPISCEMYMEQPDGFEIKNKEEFVCKLKRSIYGLPISSKDWYDLMDEILLSLDFKRCVTEPCVYFNDGVTMGLYVDDIMLIGTTENVSKFKDILSKILNIRDLGSASELLAVKIERGDECISLSQTKYIVDKAVPKLGDLNYLRSVWTMLPTDYKDSGLGKDDGVLLQKPEIYRSIMGTLLYLSNNTRPDITYSLSFLCQSFENPTQRDLKMAKHLLRYVATTKDLRLMFSKTDVPLEIYCDADWGGDKKTSRSVSGYVIKLCGAAVSWYSKKQVGIARSSMDAEYTCMSELTREIEWLVQFLGEINQSSMIELPCVVHADNASAIKLSLNNDITEAAKHIRIQCHVVKDLVKKGLIRFKYVCSADNVADIFTKNLSAVKVRKFCEMLGLKNL